MVKPKKPNKQDRIQKNGVTILYDVFWLLNFIYI